MDKQVAVEHSDQHLSVVNAHDSFFNLNYCVDHVKQKSCIQPLQARN